MLLGKRPRPQVMKRTSSLTEFSIDETTPVPSEQQQASVDHHMKSTATATNYNRWHGRFHEGGSMWRSTPSNMSTYLSSMVSPRRNSGDFAVVETASFLKACGLCKRRLAPGRDIYMYRGEIAFCSSDCRQQHMAMEERKEKCSLTSRIKGDLPQMAATTAAVPESSGSCCGAGAGETIASA